MRRLATPALVLALVAAATPAAGQLSATCDPAQIDRESYRLATEGQALNVLRPRSEWWDGFVIGKHADDLADLNDTAIYLAERARELDDRNLLAHGLLARGYVVTGMDASRAEAAWRRTLDGGGAVTWTATLYDVDARSFFMLAFDRRALRVYRFGQLAGAFEKRMGMPTFPESENARFWRAMGGCIDSAEPPEAEIAWDDVSEIRSGNWVLWIKFRELKVNLHGQTGDLTFSYNVNHGRVENLRGIAVGPTDYQRRLQHVLASMFDPHGRMKLSQKGRGAGW